MDLLSSPYDALTKHPKTVEQVLRNVTWKGWDPRTAFYEGARYCRELPAELIRSTVGKLRQIRRLPRDLHALVNAVRMADADHRLEREWREGIDDLRVLYHASPVGTSGQRALLVGVARNGRLVRAMRSALKAEPKIDPTWMAVLIAEGSPASSATARRYRRTYLPQHSELLQRLETFRGALDEPASRRPESSSPASSAASPRRSGGRMTRARFWAIVDEAGTAGDPAVVVREQLERLTPSEISSYDAHFVAAMRRAYRHDLWGAAYLIQGGCSDDGFTDFRCSLIAKGRSVYEAAVKNPDSLAEDHTDIDGDEHFGHLAAEVYEDKTGRELPGEKRVPVQREPAGDRWDFDDADEMRRRLPKLSAKFATS